VNLEHTIVNHGQETYLYTDEAADPRLHPPVLGQHAAPTPCERFDSAHNGIVVLGADGYVLYASAGAKTIAARADAIAFEGGTIRALRGGADDHALQGLIKEALLGGGQTSAMSLARRRGGRDYFIVVKALPRRVFALAGAGPAVLVTIADPDQVPRPTAAWLKRLFGLTTAETRVALKLFAGSTLGEVATALGISQATSRVHLGHIFRKTRTTRQAELIRLLMSYPWGELTSPEETQQSEG
jgi:DNA-binding CsgD family transcriptional regulator